jgi:hypothetical protein
VGIVAVRIVTVNSVEDHRIRRTVSSRKRRSVKCRFKNSAHLLRKEGGYCTYRSSLPLPLLLRVSRFG